MEDKIKKQSIDRLNISVSILEELKLEKNKAK